MQPYGEAVALTPRVRRLVAPNPGPMTGSGTNTYLVGHQQVAVIDPGPALPEHIGHYCDDRGMHHPCCVYSHAP